MILFAPTAMEMGTMEQICTTGIPKPSIVLAIVAPQRVQVPQVETMMTASTWSSFRSGMISLAILLASPCVVPVPTVE